MIWKCFWAVNNCNMLKFVSWIIMILSLFFFFNSFEFLLCFTTHIVSSVYPCYEKAISIILDIMDSIFFRIDCFCCRLTGWLRIVKHRASIIIENLHIIDVYLKIILLILLWGLPLLIFTVIIVIHTFF